MIGAFPEKSLAQTLVSVGGARRPPAGIPAVAVIQKVPMVEYEHSLAMDFPP
jgi:hypothetical protein